MISGYFAISNINRYSTEKYYKKKIKTILVPIIVFSIFYSIVSLIGQMIEYFDKGTSINLMSIITSFVTGNSQYHMWYLYMFIFIYAITPVLWGIKDRLGERKFNKLSVLLVIVSIPFALTSKHIFNYDIGFSIYYLGYYMLGYSMNKAVKIKSNIRFVIYLILGLLILLLNSIIRLYILNMGMTDASFEIPVIGNISFVDNFWLPIVLASILIYKAFLYLDFKMNLSKISKYLIYIYLFHIFVLNILMYALNKLGIIISPYIVVPVFTIAVFIISLILSKVYMFLYKKIDKNEIIENKLFSLISKLF